MKSEQVLPTEPYSHRLPSVEMSPLIKRANVLNGSQTVNDSNISIGNRSKNLQTKSSSFVTVDDEINRCYFKDSNAEDKSKHLFDGVCAYVHQKQTENYQSLESAKSLVLELGGKISNTLGISCTHFLVCDSVLEETDELVQKANAFCLKIVTPAWVLESGDRREVLDPENFLTKFLKIQESLDNRRLSNRSRARSLRSLEPAPIPAEETAIDSGIEINSSANKPTILPKPLSATPSKLNFDLRGSLARLKSSTPSSIGKAATQKGKDTNTTTDKNDKTDDSIFAQPSLPIPNNILSKFQKQSEAFNECSQSVQIGWEAESSSFGNNASNDNCNSALNENTREKSDSGAKFEIGKKKQRVFQVTNLPSEQRQLAQCMIEELGGKFSSIDAFDPQTTHLVCKAPMKSEKFLSSVARGLWVLSYDYLEQSLKTGRFLNEEDFEWGSEKLGLATVHANQVKVAASAKRWRMSLNGNHHSGAYSNWKVLLHVPKNKIKGLSSILSAGGAEVLEIQPPFSNIYGATHAFIDRDKVDCGLISCSQLSAVGVHCLKPEYIADFLIVENVSIDAYRVIDAPEATEPVCKRVRMI